LLPTNYNSKEECKNLLKENQFKVTKIITNNISIVKQNFRYGCANKSGEIVVPIIYDRISDLNDGFIKVKNNNKWGLISINDSLKLSTTKEFNNNEIFFNPDNDYLTEIGSIVIEIKEVDSIGGNIDTVLANNEISDTHKKTDYKYINSYIKDFIDADNDIKLGEYKRAIVKFEKLKSIDVYNNALINGKINVAKKYQQTKENSYAKIDSIIRIGNDLLIKKKFNLAVSIFQQAFHKGLKKESNIVRCW